MDRTEPEAREEMSEKEGGRGGDIEITVKLGARSFNLPVSVHSTVKELKSLLQPLTDVLPRGQKLIHRGKLLVDEMTLEKSEVTNGSKVMLIASQGLHQGGGPVLKEARTRPISRTQVDYKKAGKAVMQVVDKDRSVRWKATGVVALSECNLPGIPDDVWACGFSTRLLDISNNYIQDIPAKISCLSSLQKLCIDANGLSDESIHWDGLTSLKNLRQLSINHNQLTTFPSALGGLTSLQQLNIANNKLTSLPAEIGCLTQLEVLKASNNRIISIPARIGDSVSLTEVDLSSNLLSELPETMGNLQHLKALYLSNNGLKSLPYTLFKNCLQLSTLDVHSTQITMDVLRQFEGWESFDERRRTKHQKKLDFRVTSSAEFDEGADKN